MLCSEDGCSTAMASPLLPAGAAIATEGSIMPSRNPAEDKAARAFMDSRGDNYSASLPILLHTSHLDLSVSPHLRCC